MNLTERYFRGLGWECKQEIYPHSDELCDIWYQPGEDQDPDNFMTGTWGGKFGSGLPGIEHYFPDFKKWVMEEMERRGYRFAVHNNIVFKAYWFNGPGGIIGDGVHKAEIIDNDIPRAAIEAACELIEKEKE